MLIRRLKVAGLLSFGPRGIDLPLGPLNVLIGPNGSGKSNLLHVIALLKAAPRDILEPISRSGGVGEWFWKGTASHSRATVEAILHYPQGTELKHRITFGRVGERPYLADEQIQPVGENASTGASLSYYRSPRDAADGGIHFRSDFVSNHSMVSFGHRQDYPGLWHLYHQYETIRFFRGWSLGPSLDVRQPASAGDRSDFLDERGTNLPTVLMNNFHGDNKGKLVAALQNLYGGITDVGFQRANGTVTLFLEESGNRVIPATRLSDGTLRYLCLLSILLHPQPPPLVVIEEPELGLHPDVLPTLTDLLLSASERSQLIVKTHSDVIVDALTDKPESVVVCEKHDGETEMRRLDKDNLTKWLRNYTLGNLWSSGQLGGNRW